MMLLGSRPRPAALMRHRHMCLRNMYKLELRCSRCDWWMRFVREEEDPGSYYQNAMPHLIPPDERRVEASGPTWAVRGDDPGQSSGRIPGLGEPSTTPFLRR